MPTSLSKTKTIALKEYKDKMGEHGQVQVAIPQS